MNLIDTHFHLDLFNQPTKVIEYLERNKIYSIAVTNLPDVFENSYLLTKDKKYVRAALGYHPELSGTYYNKIDIFKKSINKTRFIGEVGLDFSKKYNKDNQIKQIIVFEKILEICYNRDKILTIHSRNSASKVIEMVGVDFKGTKILHWFTGTLNQARKALDCGFYFSFNKAMLKSNKGKELLNFVPLDRILTETDSPFTTHPNQADNSLEVKELYTQINKLTSHNIKIENQIYINFKEILKTNYNL
ncbi:Qat anti-phage system TatD family nuclease QatD [Tenacibaculum sp. SDUM215027]|uniref:Qat anti-phage system TatD family nuclease QatD n=1 Tax=Tenacibaculum sp. SDUM215027 TaxID=3422596 RepID=UPI003D318926